jgi:hypothetical protein
MPTADPDDDISPLSLDDDESPPVPDGLDDEVEGDRLRHASTGLLIVTIAMVTIVMSLAAASLISVMYMGTPQQFKNPWLTAAGVAFWIATVISLLGKLKICFDRQLLAEPHYLDWSLLAGVAPYVVLCSLTFLPIPGQVFALSMLGVPVSFLLFVRFLSSLAEQYDRHDLVHRARRLLSISSGALAVTLFGALFMLIAPAVGALFVVVAYLTSLVPAFLYAQLLVRLRRQI